LSTGQVQLLSIEADPIYQTILIAAEKAFWRATTGETPALLDCEPPKPRTEAVDMNTSNSWAEFAGLFCETQGAHADHERAKSELKGLMPEDAKEAMGHGIRAKRSKSGAVSFDPATPPISLDRIMRAVGLLEQMGRASLALRKAAN
jgi:hypothetical protein